MEKGGKVLKKEIWPVGYTIRYGGIITGIMIYIGLFVFFLVSGVSDSQKEIMEFKKFAMGVIIMTTILVCLEIRVQYNTYKMRKARKYIIENAINQTKGYVQKIEEEWIDYKQRRVYNPPPVDNITISLAYRIFVAYIDPEDGKRKTAESELYRDNPSKFLENSEIVVYITKSPLPMVVIYEQ